MDRQQRRKREEDERRQRKREEEEGASGGARNRCEHCGAEIEHEAFVICRDEVFLCDGVRQGVIVCLNCARRAAALAPAAGQVPNVGQDTAGGEVFVDVDLEATGLEGTLHLTVLQHGSLLDLVFEVFEAEGLILVQEVFEATITLNAQTSTVTQDFNLFEEGMHIQVHLRPMTADDYEDSLETGSNLS